MSDTPELTDRQREFIAHLPASTPTLSEALDVAPTTIEGYRQRLREKGVALEYDHAENEWRLTDDRFVQDDDEPDPSDLTERERFILHHLQTASTLEELAEELDVIPPVVRTYINELENKGWEIYHDETANLYEIGGDHTLRSSEHKGTRTRKANRWWETRHNALEREWKRLDALDPGLPANSGNEDWVTHMTDLHAGDIVHGYEGDVVHTTTDLIPLIDHITDRSLSLSEKHGSEYDTAVQVWGGDFVTNSGIYEGQFENLDAWLDEQIDVLHDPLLRQIKTFSEAFPAVHVVCQAGNHGDIRASGSSKQANADLILYKSIRNTVSALQEMGYLENVRFTIGRAGSVTPFRLRGGEIHGQLRHGQDRSPQADTSARKKEWLSTILDSMNAGDAFDIAWMGHHHVSGRLPWNGPPVLITGSPKPGGEYPRRLGELTGPNQPTIAHCHGVSDDGLTGVFPIDTRHYA